MAAEAETSAGGDAQPLTGKQKINALVAQREAFETELQEHIAELKKTPVGLNGPLRDENDFPRADCDLHMVTKRRQRIVCLRNDLRGVMAEIETTMYEMHAGYKAAAEEAKASGATSAEVPTPSEGEGAQGAGEAKAAETAAAAEAAAAQKTAALVKRYSDYPPFMTVGTVLEKSPAREAGLQEGDLVLSWNAITSQHPDPVTMIGQMTPRFENKEMPVVITRNAEVLCLTLVPKKWEGRGILGCLLQKMKK